MVLSYNTNGRYTAVAVAIAVIVVVVVVVAVVRVVVVVGKIETNQSGIRE